jgi:hypothetical protein
VVIASNTKPKKTPSILQSLKLKEAQYQMIMASREFTTRLIKKKRSREVNKAVAEVVTEIVVPAIMRIKDIKTDPASREVEDVVMETTSVRRMHISNTIMVRSSTLSSNSLINSIEEAEEAAEDLIINAKMTNTSPNTIRKILTNKSKKEEEETREITAAKKESTIKGKGLSRLTRSKR